MAVTQAGDVTMTLLDDNRAAIFDLNRTLPGGQELEVRIQFTPNVVAGSAPYWQSSADAEAAHRAQEEAYRAQVTPWMNLLLGTLGLLLLFRRPRIGLPSCGITVVAISR